MKGYSDSEIANKLHLSRQAVNKAKNKALERLKRYLDRENYIVAQYLERRGYTVENKIIELASTQGIWAALSVVFIFYILKAQEKRDIRQEEREQNYQGIISKLTDKFNIIEDVKKDVEDIKNYVFKKEN